MEKGRKLNGVQSTQNAINSETKLTIPIYKIPHKAHHHNQYQTTSQKKRDNFLLQSNQSKLVINVGGKNNASTKKQMNFDETDRRQD